MYAYDVDHGRSFEGERPRRSLHDEANRGTSRAAKFSVQGSGNSNMLERWRHALAKTGGKQRHGGTFEGFHKKALFISLLFLSLLWCLSYNRVYSSCFTASF